MPSALSDNVVTTAAALLIGNELLSGKVREANLFELARTLRGLGVKLETRFCERAKGDVPDTWADTSRARGELDYDPRVDLEDGLGREIDWYRNVYENK